MPVVSIKFECMHAEYTLILQVEMMTINIIMHTEYFKWEMIDTTVG